MGVTVTAGSTGAPAGVSLQWMTESDFALYGWGGASSCDPSIASCPESYCAASFSGNANGKVFALAPGASATVPLGDSLFDVAGASYHEGCSDLLICGETYAIRSFAHATSSLQRSAFSGTVLCSTNPCDDPAGCTYTQGFWKTHNPQQCGDGGNAALCLAWPVGSLTLGTVSYDVAALLAIFGKPAAGNGLVSLAHQLIAAKLNLANGADDSDIADTISAADALINALVVPPLGSGSLAPSASSALTSALTAYNEGASGPGHCD
jgi:hypothetical protein